MYLLKKNCMMGSKHIIKLSHFKFSQIEIASEDFYKQKQVTDILTIDVNNAQLSDRRPRINGKDWWYIASYQVEDKRSYHCLSTRQRTYLITVFHNATRTQLIQCHSMFLRQKIASISKNLE